MTCPNIFLSTARCSVSLHFPKNYWSYEDFNDGIEILIKIPYYWHLNNTKSTQEVWSYKVVNITISYLFFDIFSLESVEIYLHFLAFFVKELNNIFSSQWYIVMPGK